MEYVDAGMETVKSQVGRGPRAGAGAMAGLGALYCFGMGYHISFLVR